MLPRAMCTCHGTIHELIPSVAGALMCDNCGNIICRAQGPGPCLFCGADCINERFAVSESLVSAERIQFASPEAKQISEHLKRHVRRNPGVPLTEAEKHAAEQLRQTIMQNVEEAAEVDPATAVRDDQDGLLGLLGD